MNMKEELEGKIDLLSTYDKHIKELEKNQYVVNKAAKIKLWNQKKKDLLTEIVESTKGNNDYIEANDVPNKKI